MLIGRVDGCYWCVDTCFGDFDHYFQVMCAWCGEIWLKLLNYCVHVDERRTIVYIDKGSREIR